ncbi:MAG: tetratricopeptide repeat protein, partial [Maribacter sp.]|nr:tetratricopeptide repeat protein [Maribacter sp.]
FEKAIEINPDEPLYPRNIGDMYRETKEYEKAEKWYQKSLGIDPKYLYAYNGLGLLFKEQKLYKKAEEQFEKAIEINPDEPLYPRNIGDMYRETKEYEKAETWYQKSLGIDPKYPYAYNGLGLLFKEQKLYKKAEEQFKKAMELNPYEPLFPGNIGDVYEEVKEYEKAKYWYEGAIKINPNNFESLNTFAWFLLSSNDNLKEAEEVAVNAVKLSDENPNVIHTLAEIQYKYKGWDYAKEMVVKWVTLFSQEDILQCNDDILITIRRILKNDDGHKFIALFEGKIESFPHWVPWIDAINTILQDGNTQTLSEEANAIYQKLISN